MAFGRTGRIGEIGWLKLKREKGLRLDGVRAEKLVIEVALGTDFFRNLGEKETALLLVAF